MHLYVYYDVPHAEAKDVRKGVLAMQKRLAEECGCRGRLLRRMDQGKPYQTWMEIYEQVDAAFEAQLESACYASGLRDRLAGPRHIERFTDFD